MKEEAHLPSESGTTGTAAAFVLPHMSSIWKDNLLVQSLYSTIKLVLNLKYKTCKNVFYQYYDVNLACLHTSSFGAFLSARVILAGFFFRSSATFCQYLPVITINKIVECNNSRSLTNFLRYVEYNHRT